jgi:hypothetical protein
LVLVLILFSGCMKTDEEFENSSQPEDYFVRREGGTILGRKLEDPYAIHNIRKAYSSLRSSRGETPSLDLKPNHLYIRFLPKNNEELDILKKDTSLILYDYPLDFEIIQSGTTYHDPSLPDSSLMWQYSVLPADQLLPSIYHEVIYGVFIPPDEDSIIKNLSDEMIRFYEDLEYESVMLTGNLTEKDIYENDTKGLFRSKWTPKGTINVWDDLLDRFIPLAYVKVHARWFTHIKSDLTDENGYFQTGKFRYAVNYAIKWERSYYSIRNGMFLQAWYNGPKRKGDWNLDIKGGESVMYATIHRAAYKHFYGDNLGIFRPILKNGSKTKICYRDGNGSAEFLGDWSASGILPDIQVWGKSNGIYKKTNKIYGNTSHELGHQAHSQYVGNIKYRSTTKIIRESWADAVEWALSNDEYNKLGRMYSHLGAIYYNHSYNTHNKWPVVGNKDYSPIFIDLMDKINQRMYLGPGYPNDLVSGYTLSDLNFRILEKTSCINSLREAVYLNKVNGINEFQIEELFDLY